MDDPVFAEALTIASTDLVDALRRVDAKPDSDGVERAAAATERYFARAAARCTPFGLFAGVATARWGDRTTLVLDERSRWRRHSRLAAGVVMDIASKLASTVHDGIAHLEANGTTYHAGGALRFTRCDRTRDGWVTRLCDAESSPELEKVIQCAARPVSVHDLVEALIDSDEEREGAREYVQALVQEGLLVSTLFPSVLGPDPLTQLREACARAGVDTRELDWMHEQLASSDALGLTGDPERLAEVALRIRALQAGDEAKVGQPTHSPFQVHLTTEWQEATVSRRIVSDILVAFDFLRTFFGSEFERDALSSFKDQFRARFEAEAVPLGRALDDDFGVRFRLGEVTNAPGGRKRAAGPRMELTPRYVELLSRVQEVVRSGQLELVLDASRNRSVDDQPPPLPLGFSAMVTIGGNEGGPSEDGQILLHGGDGPSPATFISRFAEYEPSIKELVQGIGTMERASSAGREVVEVTYRPEPGIANVALRPDLGHLELTTGGNSGVPTERRLGPNDVTVQLESNRFVLRRISDDVELVPRLTSAHNFGHPELPGIYQFLGALQHQEGQVEPRWEWGPLRELPFLPRVRLGRAILSRASWRLPVAARQGRSTGQEDAGARALESWRRERRVPRFVTFGEGDQFLPADLEDARDVRALLRWAATAPRPVVTELWPEPADNVVRSEAGRFAHELVVPFVRRERAVTDRPTVSRGLAHRAVATERVLLPGGEWFYVRLSCSVGAMTRIVREAVAPLIAAARSRLPSLDWHFVRYGDPAWHVRIRMKLGSPSDWSWAIEAMREATAPLHASGVITEISVDTYRREIERYGGNRGILAAERLFTVDSDAALAWLAARPTDPERRLVDLVDHCNRLLDGIGLSREARARVAAHCAESWGASLQLSRSDRRWLQDRYRGVGQSAVRRVLATEERTDAADVRTLFADTGAREYSSDLGITSSYLHMALNRRLEHADRRDEVLVYHALAKALASAMAIERTARGGLLAKAPEVTPP